jgi:hypothetical protein
MSTVMTPSQQFITIQVMDQGSNKPVPRNVQWRTMMGYRNQGNCLVHTPTVAAGVSGSQTAAPVVVESFEELLKYHRPDYVYTLVYRPSYHVPTFAVALSVIGDPAVPEFTHLSDCLNDFRSYYTLLDDVERKTLPSEWAQIGPMKRMGQITNRYDCLMSNARASALVSGLWDEKQCATPEVMVTSLRDFHDRSHYAHFLSTRLRDQRQQKRWQAFFAKKTYLFLGVPESTAANKHVLSTAHELGVGLMVRRGLHYALLRY